MSFPFFFFLSKQYPLINDKKREIIKSGTYHEILQKFVCFFLLARMRTLGEKKIVDFLKKKLFAPSHYPNNKNVSRKFVNETNDKW